MRLIKVRDLSEFQQRIAAASAFYIVKDDDGDYAVNWPETGDETLFSHPIGVVQSVGAMPDGTQYATVLINPLGVSNDQS